jgi:hypothetical protein
MNLSACSLPSARCSLQTKMIASHGDGLQRENTLAASAYETQFIGAFPLFRASTIWQAKSKPKCRFFAWLAIQNKAPTADNLLKKNWSCNPNCPLCYCMPETSQHLFTECNLTEAVWDKLAQQLQLNSALKPFQKGDVHGWLQAVLRAGSKKEQHIFAGVILFFWWSIWKKRNQMIFEGIKASFLHVAEQAKI